MKTVLERFFNYISIDTTSKENSDIYPSSDSQWILARLLKKELEEIGLSEVALDEFGYVTASIPATDESLPPLGLIAHMDTSNAVPGGPIHPSLITYEGGDILLNRKLNICLKKRSLKTWNSMWGRHWW